MSNEEIIGKVIEGYKIIKALGQGQYSYVYHAERKADGQHCALKIVKVSSIY